MVELGLTCVNSLWYLMGKKRKKRGPPAPKSFYPLEEVKALVAQGKVVIRPNALECAGRDFGWGVDDILDAF